MAIKSTAQMIHLTCDQCETIQDRIPVSPGIWQAIEQAGWQVNREARSCVCPDCLFEAGVGVDSELVTSSS